jgi:hypothetical protein
MSDEPNPLNDVRRGLGLLFRAARTAARKLPTTDLENVVATSAREVGRAIENVAATIEREMFPKGGAGKPSAPSHHVPGDSSSTSAKGPTSASDPEKSGEEKDRKE